MTTELQLALDYFGAKEVAPTRYAWKRLEYDCYVVGDAEAAHLAMVHHVALAAPNEGEPRHFEDDYCLTADAVTCMPSWWMPEQRFVWRVTGHWDHGDGTSTYTSNDYHDRDDARNSMAGLLGPTFQRITADLQTGAEVRT